MNVDFIDYKDDKGFYISNIFMLLAIYFINEEFKKDQYVFVNKNRISRYHSSIINGHEGGYFALCWDLYIENSSEEQTMVQVLQTVKTIIQNKGVNISIAELQAIPTTDKDFKLFYSRKPFPTSELIKILDALIKMLQGTWDSTNYDMEINYQY